MSLGQLAFALAAAVGVVYAVDWPKRRDEFAYSGIFGAAGALLTSHCFSVVVDGRKTCGACRIGTDFLRRLGQ
ncbi:MAG: hypothetical protein R3F37_11780 [Candidatus Competibacteraceae bacterium]